jgi:hypothetical protein
MIVQNPNRPNQAPEPTSIAVTPRALRLNRFRAEAGRPVQGRTKALHVGKSGVSD